MAAVLVVHRAVVRVPAARNVVRHQVQVFLALGLALAGLVLAGDALAVAVDRAAGQVVDRLLVGPGAKPR